MKFADDLSRPLKRLRPLINRRECSPCIAILMLGIWLSFLPLQVAANCVSPLFLVQENFEAGIPNDILPRYESIALIMRVGRPNSILPKARSLAALVPCHRPEGNSCLLRPASLILP